MKKSVILVVTLVALVSIISILLLLHFNARTVVVRNVPKTGNYYVSQIQPNDPQYAKLQFSISLLNHLQNAEPNKSIFYSPHSVYLALFLVYFGAAGETEKELKNALGLNWVERKSDMENLYNLEKNVNANRFQDDTIEFQSADKLFFSSSIPIDHRTTKMLNDSIELLNFADEPDQCIAHINRFVEEVTKNNIKNFTNSNEITSQTQLAVVNAAYFKGIWENIFDKKKTTKKLFYSYSEPDPVYVDMMIKEDVYYEFASNFYLEADVLKIPYKGESGSISMFVFLPHPDQAIEKLLEKLTPEILDNTSNRMIRSKVDLSFPKFSIEKTSNLIPIMKRMGVKELFDENANLSGFSKSLKQASDIRHKAKIEVDEWGTTAAAATKVYSQWSRSSPFNCDHPFLFLIYDKKMKEILFAGTYHGPEITH
ncbi:serine protease inhibitor 88Ea-like [Contarinia nasturtii]|uniref:serine protease inhibitor 88Ea-like n=1 Tax=Contarinia nasturtii TaxID=265458 RepID=UPI0012D471B1|nr:serine protease inhibitor 88Ea-like [Contarinia nasturtii]